MTTLEEAKQHLRDNWKEGTICPCCTQRVQLYRFKVNSQMAKVLIQLYHQHNAGHEWVNIFGDLRPKTTMYALAAHWGLIVQRGDEPNNNAKSSGYWRLTDYGRSFVEQGVSIPKYVFVFNNKVYNKSPEVVDIKECLGSKFNYSELFGGQ